MKCLKTLEVKCLKTLQVSKTFYIFSYDTVSIVILYAYENTHYVYPENISSILVKHVSGSSIYIYVLSTAFDLAEAVRAKYLLASHLYGNFYKLHLGPNWVTF